MKGEIAVRKTLVLCALACGGLEGLEFGEMGNTSFGMGGAGVALENSAWGLYYNPALLDMDECSKAKLGYSFGIGVREKNILPLVSSALQGSSLDDLTQLAEQLPPQALQSLVQGGTLSIDAAQSPTAQTIVNAGNALKDFLKLNGLHVDSQNGIVVQISPKLKNHKGGIGTFSIGVFASLFAGASAVTNPRYHQLIAPLGHGFYAGAQINKDSLTLSQSNQSAFLNSSLLSPYANNAARVQALGIGAVPFAYAKGFDLKKAGRIAFGVTFKYLYTLSYGLGFSGAGQAFIANAENLLSNFSFSTQDMVRQSHFGLDLGGAYRIKGFMVGLVGKYLNAPKIRYAHLPNMRIDPQVRLGLGYRWKWLNLAMDFDLTSNQTMMLDKRSQMIGGGVMFNWKWFALKLGAMGNVAKEGLHQGVILTGGIRLFKVIDFSVQSGLQTVALGGSGAQGILGSLASMKLPNYLAFRVGGVGSGSLKPPYNLHSRLSDRQLFVGGHS
ncbi:conjugal transfer protein TraF [Helicobacter gastrocanis]|nr:conjugal transfer protein TraF [Helicobacter sp. NHP19-003]